MLFFTKISKRVFRFTVLFFACSIFLFTACRDDRNISTDAADKLSFSTDTLRFDTVFTTIGSATRYFKVFNTTNQTLIISKIALANKTSARFNLNIDGVSGRSFSAVEVPPNDSIYVFAEVTVDPNAPLSTSPFVISEDLVFETNGNMQRVVLEAWGQNANYVPNRFASGKLAVLNGNGGVIEWSDKKPYVIYGVLFLDSVTLKVAAGTRIYVHGGLARPSTGGLYQDGIIFVLPTAKLLLEGTLEKPIILEGDRLEKEFENVPGQWAGIILSALSTGNSFKNAIIRNSRVGVRVDSAADLTLKNTQIYNTASSAIIGLHANISAENSLFFNAGGNAVQLEFGGNYTFNFCTLSSLGSRSAALSMNNARCYEALGNGCRQGFLKTNAANALFQNCIVYGGKEDEIAFLDATAQQGDFNYTFRNNIIRVKDLLKPDNTPDFLQKCTNCLNAKSTDKLFRRPSSNDFHLDTLSIAERKGFFIPTILKDLDDKMRKTDMPDLGCYEFAPRK
jgi:hypothetical protein